MVRIVSRLTGREIRQPPTVSVEAGILADSAKAVAKLEGREFRDGSQTKSVKTLEWVGGLDGHLRLIDQTRLPVEFAEIDCRDVETVWEAIKMLRVRGAPAIGIAAAYGVCLGLQAAAGGDEAAFFRRLDEVTDTWPPAGRRPSISSGPWSA